MQLFKRRKNDGQLFILKGKQQYQGRLKQEFRGTVIKNDSQHVFTVQLENGQEMILNRIHVVNAPNIDEVPVPVPDRDHCQPSSCGFQDKLRVFISKNRREDARTLEVDHAESMGELSIHCPTMETL